jgi:hypothetical protein
MRTIGIAKFNKKNLGVTRKVLPKTRRTKFTKAGVMMFSSARPAKHGR